MARFAPLRGASSATGRCTPIEFIVGSRSLRARITVHIPHPSSVLPPWSTATAESPIHREGTPTPPNLPSLPAPSVGAAAPRRPDSSCLAKAADDGLEGTHCSLRQSPCSRLRMPLGLTVLTEVFGLIQTGRPDCGRHVCVRSVSLEPGSVGITGQATVRGVGTLLFCTDDAIRWPVLNVYPENIEWHRAQAVGSTTVRRLLRGGADCWSVGY